MKQFFLITSLLISTFIAAQDSLQLPQNPKVGLVLSGGGAKGIAHIGVLKVIDSLNIKLDYISGTSMGAIIGALYASGYSGKQLDSIFKNIDFETIINDGVPRESQTFYERENSERYAITLPIKNFKISIPSALSRGQNTFNLLTRLLLHVSDVQDFSKLPIPFLCVATDIETGEQVLLDKGQLPQALLASGALPTLYQPVILGNKTLIDGGVVNNYPLNELKARGVNVIIGVDVQDGLYKKEDINSVVDVLFQMSNFKINSGMNEKIKQTDIYIQPDIKDFSVVSFEDGEKIMSNGYNKAKKQSHLFNQIKQKQNAIQNPPIKIKHIDSIKLNTVEVNGIKNYTSAYVLGKLKLKAGETLSYNDFSKGVNNLVATNNFEAFNYALKKTKNKAGYNLITNLTETKETTFLRLGIHFDELYRMGVLANFTKKNLITNNDALSIDLIFGERFRYNLEYFIDKGYYWSVGFKSRLNEFDSSINIDIDSNSNVIFQGSNLIDFKSVDVTNQFYVQTFFRKDFALQLGTEHKYYNIFSESLIINSNENETVFDKSNYYSLFGNVLFDTYDNKYFPNSGVYFNGDLHWYFLSDNSENIEFQPFYIAQAKLGYAFSFFNHFSVNIKAQGGFKIKKEPQNAFNFFLGGYGNDFINNFYPFYGYDFGHITGNSMVSANLSLDYEIFNKSHIILGANYANIEDNLFDSTDWFSLPDYSGYALGYSLETFIGPVEVKYTWSPETNNSIWFFNVGFWF